MKSVVAHVSPWGIHCGIAKHLSYWLPHVPPDRRMVMLAEDPPKWYEQREDWPGLEVDRCWQRGKADALPNIQAAAERHGVGIVHWQYDPSWFPPKYVDAYGEWACARDVKTVVTAHTLEDVKPFIWHQKAILRNVDQLVVGTPGMARAWKAYAERFQIPIRRPIEVVPLPAPPIAPPGEEHLGEGPIILTWGMLSTGKGHTEVHLAVCALRKAGYPNARYLIVGQAITGEQRNNLAALRAVEATGGGTIEIVEEFRDEDALYRLCRGADVIVLNHQWQHESSSGTVALSVASGTPTVVSTSPMFSGYEGAVIVAERGVEGMVAAIERALVEPDCCSEGRARVMELITGEAVAARYEGIYQALEETAIHHRDTEVAEKGKTMALDPSDITKDDAKEKRAALLAGAAHLLGQAANGNRDESDRLLYCAEILLKKAREL